jgi:RNA polymerase sigma-70 factor (ECF subfamily)
VELYSFDDDYVRRLKAEDRWTEEHFLSYFQQLLHLKLRNRVRSQQQIDDIRQEVFVRVFRVLRSPDGVRDGRKLGAFVNSVCNNVLFETFRANGRTDQLADDFLEVPDSVRDAETAFVSEETGRRVRRVLDGMTGRDAEILRALFLEERDKDEICGAFGVDRDYFRVVLHRAKEKFRAQYESKVAPFRETDGSGPALRR